MMGTLRFAHPTVRLAGNDGGVDLYVFCAST